MKDFCVLGSGVAGSTIANLLSKKYSVEVFDKARGPGGRSSNKRFKKNSIKYIGTKGNNAISKYQLKNIKQSFASQIIRIERKKYFWDITLKDKSKHQFKSLILTCPFPQLKKLARNYLDKRISNLKVKMQPNITVMVAFKNQKDLPISSIKFDDEILTWASNENSKKRFKSNFNLWTLQASLKWSKKKINKYKNDKSIMNQLISRFSKLSGFEKNNLIHKNIHGWKYSYNYEKTPFLSSWNKKYQLGICGDWFNGPKVENAWLSANDLAKRIL